MSSRAVLFYGKSLLLSLVAANLTQSPELRVIQAATWEEVDALTAECIPDVLIYDLASAFESRILPLLFRNPRLLLIGLDPETNRAVLLKGQDAYSLTLARMKEFAEGSEEV